jgi:hypothetical protein
VAKADLPEFKPEAAPTPTAAPISRKSWDIQFATGKAQFTPRAEETLEILLRDLVIAGGLTVEIHGHTDNQGGADKNMQLSEDRAFAVKKWLEGKSPANFPQGRVRVFAHGATQPLAPNSSAEGRAQNRRVEIVPRSQPVVRVVDALLPNRLIDRRPPAGAGGDLGRARPARLVPLALRQPADARRGLVRLRRSLVAPGHGAGALHHAQADPARAAVDRAHLAGALVRDGDPGAAAAGGRGLEAALPRSHRPGHPLHR